MRIAVKTYNLLTFHILAGVYIGVKLWENTLAVNHRFARTWGDKSFAVINVEMFFLGYMQKDEVITKIK